jgi:hypothetical protein
MPHCRNKTSLKTRLGPYLSRLPSLRRLEDGSIQLSFCQVLLVNLQTTEGRLILFWCRKHNGAFILRIEDTDQSRLVVRKLLLV